jgi:hypothetical protein
MNKTESNPNTGPKLGNWRGATIERRLVRPIGFIIPVARVEAQAGLYFVAFRSDTHERLCTSACVLGGLGRCRATTT